MNYIKQLTYFFNKAEGLKRTVHIFVLSIVFQSNSDVISDLPNMLLCVVPACATKHLKDTKGFDHFCPSKVMPCRGERRKGFEGGIITR